MGSIRPLLCALEFAHLELGNLADRVALMSDPCASPVIRLRPATPADARYLYDIRNDPQTRVASLNDAELSYDDHYQWFNRSLSEPSRRLFVAERDGHAIGTGRLDEVDGSTLLSWALAPEARGKGYGTELVQALAAAASGALVAYIKPDNWASRRIAERAGFVFQTELDGLCRYVREPV